MVKKIKYNYLYFLLFLKFAFSIPNQRNYPQKNATTLLNSQPLSPIASFEYLFAIRHKQKIMRAIKTKISLLMLLSAQKKLIKSMHLFFLRALTFFYSKEYFLFISLFSFYSPQHLLRYLNSKSDDLIIIYVKSYYLSQFGYFLIPYFLEHEVDKNEFPFLHLFNIAECDQEVFSSKEKSGDFQISFFDSLYDPLRLYLEAAGIQKQQRLLMSKSALEFLLVFIWYFLLCLALSTE